MRWIAAGTALLFLLGACGGDSAGSEAFCDATRTVLELGDFEEVPPELDEMVEEAPDEIKDAVETVRDGFVAAIENQDPAELETEEFLAAATEVREYALENCEGFTDESGE